MYLHVLCILMIKAVLGVLKEISQIKTALEMYVSVFGNDLWCGESSFGFSLAVDLSLGDIRELGFRENNESLQSLWAFLDKWRSLSYWFAYVYKEINSLAFSSGNPALERHYVPPSQNKNYYVLKCKWFIWMLQQPLFQSLFSSDPLEINK